jgi:8-amino-7-oxononanoate synthase
VEFLTEELHHLEEMGLYRRPLIIEGVEGPFVVIGGKRYLSFSSNNYLGLAGHPRIKEVAQRAIETYGWGSGASRLVSGTTTLHEALESALGVFKGQEAAIVFPTGYMANVGTICALVSRGDIVIGDRLNHASIVDACRQSGANFRVYPHKDMDKLGGILKRSSLYHRRLIVTDSVFSVDGDLAPLTEIVELAKRYGAMTMVDDAHGTGVFGKRGRGALEHLGLEGKVDIQMGTFSKALGGMGGFVAGSRTLIEYLRNKSRAFIYTTALPPAACAAAMEGLRLLEEEPWRRETLWQNVSYMEKGLRDLGLNIRIESPIIPILLGEVKRALEVSRMLFEKGLLVPAIRPPTVPEGTSRLRISLMAGHEQGHLDRLLEALREVKSSFF